jgi:hypothetical protein
VLGDISAATNIYIITGYTDMRKSIDGLYAIILDQLKAEPDARSPLCTKSEVFLLGNLPDCFWLFN